MVEAVDNKDFEGVYIIDDPKVVNFRGTASSNNHSYLRIFFRPCSNMERSDCRPDHEIEQFLAFSYFTFVKADNYIDMEVVKNEDETLQKTVDQKLAKRLSLKKSTFFQATLSETRV